jgi:hypothetical protein
MAGALLRRIFNDPQRMHAVLGLKIRHQRAPFELVGASRHRFVAVFILESFGFR